MWAWKIMVFAQTTQDMQRMASWYSPFSSLLLVLYNPTQIQSESVLVKAAVAWRINNSTSSHHQGKKELNKQSLMICYQGCLVFRWPAFFWILLGKGYLQMLIKRCFLTFSLCLVIVAQNKWINLQADCFISSYSGFHSDIRKTWHSLELFTSESDMCCISYTPLGFMSSS